MKTILFLILILMVFVLYKNLKTPKNIGVKNQKISPCSWTPNCVSSNSTKKQFQIDPLPFISENSLSIIEEFLLKTYKAKVISKTSTYLHVVITTPILHWKDDLEFLINPDKTCIAVRSSSRVGYSDLDMNRKRIERIRNFLNGIKACSRKKHR